jgi:aspartate/tyrosine/aromatic aminotransferase
MVSGTVDERLDRMWSQRQELFEELEASGLTIAQRTMVSQLGTFSREIGQLQAVARLMREFGVETG